jgi:pimeloyl-ACP methyl ester carboxylesterase
VLSNESDQDQRSWQAYADHLVGEGYKVAMWDYAEQDPVANLTAIVADLRAHGSGPVFLLGASKGGKASLIAAAGIKPPVTAVVTLSAEATLSPDLDVSSYVKQLTCPVLLLTAAQDGYGSADAAKTFQTDLPNLAHTLTYDGSDHGTHLLTGVNGAKVVADIDAFLKTH